MCSVLILPGHFTRINVLIQHTWGGQYMCRNSTFTKITRVVCNSGQFTRFRPKLETFIWHTIVCQNSTLFFPVLFCEDPWGLRFGLCLDSTNPFSKEKSTYSMWPIIVSLMNIDLPWNLCFLLGFTQLVRIIPGKHEPKNTDAYLSLLVDELQSLDGCVLFDAFQNNTFQLRTRLLLHALDYPGVNKVFHCHDELSICK